MINKSCAKVLEMLKLFSAERPVLTLSEAAKLSDMPKPTALRILNTLEQQDFVVKMPDGKYKLGLALLHFGNLVLSQLNLHKIAFHYMEQLCNETGLCVRLLVRDGNRAIFIDKVFPVKNIGIYNMSGLRMKLYLGTSRALIAFLATDELNALIERFRQEDDLHRGFVEQLRTKLENERNRGYSFSSHEYVEGTAGMAMPVRDNAGAVIACISIAGLCTQFTGDRMQALCQSLQKTVNSISRELGYAGPEIGLAASGENNSTKQLIKEDPG